MARSLEMNFIREILRMSEELHLSQRETAKAVGKSRDAVSNVLKMAKALHISYLQAKEMKDDELKSKIYPNINPYRDIPEPDLDWIDHEMKTHKHMTMTILHQEYLEKYPNGLKYTQFCERYRKYIESRRISMHIERKCGERMKIDWVGDKLYYYDTTGKKCVACFFVTVLGRSTYPYVEAFPNQKASSFKLGTVHALNYYGGVPSIFVPDNDKSAVTQASKYDSVLNATFSELVDYYGAVCIPARVRHPRDKPGVEKTVFDAVERYIMLKIRNETFHSISEINKAVWKHLEDFVNKPFQKKDGSRKSIFIEEDKPALMELPSEPYQIIDIGFAKVNIDYHIEFDHKYYSVPYQYKGKTVEVKAKPLTIEIWHNNERICTHTRSYKKLYTTNANHMPPNHQAYNQINQQTFKKWAASISKDLVEFMNGMYNGVKIEETKYRGCLGLQKLSRANKVVFLKSIKLCNENKIYTFRACNDIFKELIKQSLPEEETPIKNDNPRGPEYYKE